MLHEGQPGETNYGTWHTLPEREQAQARILRDGPDACSTVELLEIMIGGRDAERIARQLLNEYQDLRTIANRSIIELALRVRGLSLKRASQIKASIELGKRLPLAAIEQKPQIRSPADAAGLLMPRLSLLEQEEVHVIMLDTRNRVLGITQVYRGSLNAASMRISELFREAIRINAAAIIVAHNHPSSDPSPSGQDIHVTREIIKAGKLLEMDTLDHIIIGGTAFTSLKERGLAFGE
jgi:DNA repair protein RadC